MTEVYNVKDHMAIFPVLLHAYNFRPSWVFPLYLRAVSSISAIQSIETQSLKN